MVNLSCHRGGSSLLYTHNMRRSARLQVNKEALVKKLGVYKNQLVSLILKYHHLIPEGICYILAEQNRGDIIIVGIVQCSDVVMSCAPLCLLLSLYLCSPVCCHCISLSHQFACAPLPLSCSRFSVDFGITFTLRSYRYSVILNQNSKILSPTYCLQYN